MRTCSSKLRRMKNSNLTGLLPIGPMAAHLGLAPRELRAEAESGKIPHVKVGERGLLFDPERVLAVLTERARESDRESEGPR